MKLFQDFVKSKRGMVILGSAIAVAALLILGICFFLPADVSGYYSKQTDKKSYSAMVTKQKDGGYKIFYSLKSKEGLHTFSNTNIELFVSEQVVIGKRVIGTYVAQEQKDKEEQSNVEVIFKKDALAVSGLGKKDILLNKVNIK